MALEIIDTCINCEACLPLCPNKAILVAAPPQFPHFMIVAERCNECAGDHDVPQCASICPVEGAIIDALGRELNPPGSLTGLPPALAWRSAAG